MLTKEKCIHEYEQCKRSKNGEIPEYREFLKHAGIDKRKLARLFGTSAYSKLQEAAGDTPNKLKLERLPFRTIMQQYGNLVMELGTIPAYPDWLQRGLKPTESGLRAKPHNMRWSELPTKFAEWVKANKIAGFEKAIDIISATIPKRIAMHEDADQVFMRLIREVREWTPARRRNNEGEYKIELRKHLEALKYELNEEFGESKYDLLIRKQYAVEVKKDPDLGEYDRLFGQIARHLQHQCKVIVLILEATRKDKFDNFTALVDKYLNVGGNSVEVVKKS